LKNSGTDLRRLTFPLAIVTDYSPYKHLINEEYKMQSGYRIFAAVGIDNAFRGMRSVRREETEETRGEKLMKRMTKRG